MPSTSTLSKSPVSVSKCTPVRWRTLYLQRSSASTKPKISQPARQSAMPGPETFLATTVARVQSFVFWRRAVAATPQLPGRNKSGQSRTTLPMTSLLRLVTFICSTCSSNGILKARSESLTTSCGHSGVICSSLSSRKNANAQSITTSVRQRPPNNITACSFSNPHGVLGPASSCMSDSSHSREKARPSTWPLLVTLTAAVALAVASTAMRAERTISDSTTMQDVLRGRSRGNCTVT
mmetsp:Transcript_91170/g.237555  ORF Transcript_91170/g.237555 Transcript_91170/m.237555 type:complete len:237 (-) Transcript_91170:90-800(-)